MKGLSLFQFLCFLGKIQEPSLTAEMTEIMLVQTPPPVPVKLLSTDVAQKIWIVFYIFVPENKKIKIFSLFMKRVKPPRTLYGHYHWPHVSCSFRRL